MTVGKEEATCRRSDCFACVNGECTVLDAVGSCCPFYKTKEQNRRGIRTSFYRLAEKDRIDLILKYKDTLFDLGVFDYEIRIAAQYRAVLEEFRRGKRARGVALPVLFLLPMEKESDFCYSMTKAAGILLH